jgi:hypothetical protein
MFLQDVTARHLRLQTAGISRLVGAVSRRRGGVPRCERVVDSEARSAGWYPSDGAPALRR